MIESARGPSRFAFPPLIYLCGLAAGIVLTLLYPLPWFDDVLGDVLFAVGGLGVFTAAALWFSATRAMRRAKTTLVPAGMPAHLVTGGAFAVSRNPIYLGWAIFIIAIGLIAGSAWYFLCAFIAAFVIWKLVIEREEKVLAQKFGKKYRDYAKRVRRWI